MNKFTNNLLPPALPGLRPGNIQVGQAFMATIGGMTESLYLRVYNGIVNLITPTLTYMLADYPTPGEFWDIKISSYRPVDLEVTINLRKVSV